MAKSTKTSKANKAKAIASEEITPIVEEEKVEVTVENEAERPATETANVEEVTVEESAKEEAAEKPVIAPVTDEPVADIGDKDAEGAIGKGVVINCQKLNVRKEPSISAAVARIVNANTIIPIYETVGDWYKTKHGYVMAKFIKLINQ